MSQSITTLAATLAFVAIAVVGCDSTPHSEATPPPADPHSGDPISAMAEPVFIIDHFHGNGDPSLDTPGVKLYTSADDVTSDTLKQINVDWDSQNLVVLTVGEQSTGGYWARITAVQEEGPTLVVQGTVNAPGDDNMTTDALTYPYAAALIAKTNATVTFSDITSTKGEEAPF